jgi:hypothetical protein
VRIRLFDPAHSRRGSAPHSLNVCEPGQLEFQMIVARLTVRSLLSSVGNPHGAL